MLGTQARRNPDLVRQVAAEGHALGSHSGTHKELTKLKPKAIRKEISAGVSAIQSATGVRPVWFRPPYGATNAEVRKQAQGARHPHRDVGHRYPRLDASRGPQAVPQRGAGRPSPGRSCSCTTAARTGSRRSRRCRSSSTTCARRGSRSSRWTSSRPRSSSGAAARRRCGCYRRVCGRMTRVGVTTMSTVSSCSSTGSSASSCSSKAMPMRTQSGRSVGRRRS